MRIEFASSEDTKDILKLQKIAYQSEAKIYNDFAIPPLLQTIEDILEECSYMTFLKVVLNDEIVGSVRAHQKGDTCFIGKLIVHPDHQDQGLGTRLIEKIESCFPEAKRYELFTGEKSEKNLYLYQKLGYDVYKTEVLNEKVKIHFLEKSDHKKKMNEIKVKFEKFSSKYDNVIVKLIPYYDDMLDAVINSIAFSKNDNIKVMDLGCGTGNLSLKVKESFPNADITCVDMTPTMIKIAKDKLREFKDIKFIIAEFSSFTFTEKYDVIVSSMSLHHLTNDDKILFYTKIHDALNSNGVFYNFDVILGASDRIQEIYMNAWKKFLKKNYDEEQIKNIINDYHEEDHPAIFFEQLKWLEEIGFKEIDVIHKYYNFAVYGGKK